MTEPRGQPSVDWVTLEGGDLRVLSRGRGERLVFLPSLGGSYDLYEPLIDRLAERRTVTVVEAFGAGASDDPSGVPSVRALAEAVVAALEALEIERFDLVGLSLGGMVAQWVAALAPARVRRLVLASTAVSGIRGVLSGDARNAAMARCLLVPDEEDMTRCLGGKMAGDGASDETLEQVADASVAQPASRNALVWLSMAAGRHDGRDALEGLTVPTLVLSGELDSILPPDEQARTLEHLGRGEHTILAGVGHDLGLEAPERMAEAIEAFLETA